MEHEAWQDHRRPLKWAAEMSTLEKPPTAQNAALDRRSQRQRNIWRTLSTWPSEFQLYSTSRLLNLLHFGIKLARRWNSCWRRRFGPYCCSCSGRTLRFVPRTQSIAKFAFAFLDFAERNTPGQSIDISDKWVMLPFRPSDNRRTMS